MKVKKSQVWLLTVGEYADQHVLGVFFGTQREAIYRSIELEIERRAAGEPDDMIEVKVEKAEVL